VAWHQKCCGSEASHRTCVELGCFGHLLILSTLGKVLCCVWPMCYLPGALCGEIGEWESFW